jgi:hypothetical protein
MINVMEFKRHLLFNSLKYWGNRMLESYIDQNEKLIEYYEGKISGTIEAMHTMRIISYNTYIILDNMLTSKRNELRGEYKC